MEESLSAVKNNARKRKEYSQSLPNFEALMGITTRSKARIYLHHNRSGICRSDPIPSKSISDNRSVGAFQDMNCNDASRISSIKDLRMKRVFTPGVISVLQEEKDEKTEELQKLMKGSDASRVLAPDVDDVKVDKLECPELMISEADDERNDAVNGLNSKDQEISGNAPLSTSKMAINRCSRKRVFKSSSSFSYRRLLPYLMDIANDTSKYNVGVSKIEIVDVMNCEVRSTPENNAVKTECDMLQFDDSKPLENQGIEKVHIPKGRGNDMNGDDASVEEHIQTTPPDPAMFTKTEYGHVREPMEANKELAENQTFLGLSVQSAQSNSDALKQSPSSKCSTNSVNRSVLNPCSRPRLFKNPRSISYKRLLPFLMDVSRNNSCASINIHNPIPQVVLEEDNPVNKVNTEKPDEKQGTEDFAQHPSSSLIPLPHSDGSSLDTNNILASSMPQSSSINCSSDLDMKTEEMLEIQTRRTNVEQSPELIYSTSPSEPSSVVDSNILIKQYTSEEPESVGKQKMCLDTGLKFLNSNIESIEKVKLERNSFQVKAPNALICPNNRHPKGILKRTPLGCRGLCNCLNCSSFRLHADRAFEFSRNQMRDAEEVSSELMNELANLRLLLEKSIIQSKDSAGIQLDHVLIKQACNKAQEAEEMAKQRLNELNYDLNVHCRIPALLRPKVTFDQ